LTPATVSSGIHRRVPLIEIKAVSRHLLLLSVPTPRRWRRRSPALGVPRCNTSAEATRRAREDCSSSSGRRETARNSSYENSRPRRDSRLIVKTSARFGQLAGISKLNPRRRGTRFYKAEVRSDLASVERAGSAGKHCSPRARGDKNSRSGIPANACIIASEAAAAAPPARRRLRSRVASSQPE
jgi:hypothetical protein